MYSAFDRGDIFLPRSDVPEAEISRLSGGQPPYPNSDGNFELRYLALSVPEPGRAVCMGDRKCYEIPLRS